MVLLSLTFLVFNNPLQNRFAVFNIDTTYFEHASNNVSGEVDVSEMQFPVGSTSRFLIEDITPESQLKSFDCPLLTIDDSVLGRRKEDKAFELSQVKRRFV